MYALTDDFLEPLMQYIAMGRVATKSLYPLWLIPISPPPCHSPMARGYYISTNYCNYWHDALDHGSCNPHSCHVLSLGTCVCAIIMSCIDKLILLAMTLLQLSLAEFLVQ